MRIRILKTTSGELLKLDMSGKRPRLIEESKPIENNARVKNAKKIQIGDVKFDSKLEGYAYQIFQGMGFTFEHQFPFVLQEKCRFHGEAVREIKWITDFCFPEHKIVVDTKGYPTEIAKLKIKMFKFQHPNYTLFLPKNQKEVDGICYQIKDLLKNS